MLVMTRALPLQWIVNLHLRTLDKLQLTRVQLDTHIVLTSLPIYWKHQDNLIRPIHAEGRGTTFSGKVLLTSSVELASCEETELSPTITGIMAVIASSPLKRSVKLSCIQLSSGSDKAANLAHAREKVLEAAQAGAKIIVLPECFNSPYGCNFFSKYAEPLTPSPPPVEKAPSYHALSAMAAEAGVYLVGGSIPEVDSTPEGRTYYYNTCLVFGPDGSHLASHRKVHLFDIDIPGKIRFHESDVLSPGNKLTIVDLPDYGKIGVGICYDIRFPELGMVAARRGAFALVFPAAFNMTTGPLHWKLQGQARAMDNQLYVALCAPARDMGASYHAWGHSLITDPWAQVVTETDEKESVVSWELDPITIQEARTHIPLTSQRRFDLYPDVSQGCTEA
ncbi:carbon-nitrogen hydrolase [Xylariales sp. PMI_506]|nr:carbon-nitrogen hydrolase [Xylariales sp. PMI_506]